MIKQKPHFSDSEMWGFVFDNRLIKKKEARKALLKAGVQNLACEPLELDEEE